VKNLIILYGPPGVGKYTVGKEVAKRLGLGFLHNHTVVDFVVQYFPMGTKAFSDLSRALRLLVLKELFKTEKKGVVMTLVYGVETFEGKAENAFVRQILNVAKAEKARVSFVKLQCEDSTLYKRVALSSRKRFKKLTDPRALRKIRGSFSVDGRIRSVESIEINNTKLSPKNTAEVIGALL